MIIKFKVRMKYKPWHIKEQLYGYLRSNNSSMFNLGFNKRVWELVRFVWRFQDGMHWRPYYSELLNKAIKEHLATDKYIPDPIKKLIDAFPDNIKDIKVDLKYGSHSEDKVRIKGVFIKTKACHFPIVLYDLHKLSDNILGCTF